MIFEFTTIIEKEKQIIITFEKLEPANDILKL